MRGASAWLCLASLAWAHAATLNEARVHLVDAHAGAYFFRGPNPVDKQNPTVYNLTALLDGLRSAASGECAVSLPSNFTLVTLDLENLADPGYSTEINYWKAHPAEGRLVNWITTGSLLEPKHTPGRDALVESGAWAIGGEADHLASRLTVVRSMLRNASGPTVLYAHCNAGCDRTGEFIAAYTMTYLGYNVTTAYGEACRQCGRCPNYYSTSAIGWWCLTLQRDGRTDLGDCLGFAGCKFLGDCDAHNATPAAHPCPTP